LPDIRLTKPTLTVLRLLLESQTTPRSGADIAAVTRIASGTLYPMLVRLEAAGWLTSEWEDIDPRTKGRPRKRFYMLTPFGQRSANQELADLQISMVEPAWTI